jgi:hypothetical protein
MFKKVTIIIIIIITFIAEYFVIVQIVLTANSSYLWCIPDVSRSSLGMGTEFLSHLLVSSWYCRNFIFRTSWK